jgi:hypothetical protein
MGKNFSSDLLLHKKIDINELLQQGSEDLGENIQHSVCLYLL